MKTVTVEHEFVEFIPNELSADTLFISIPYATAVHLCLCGCDERVVTPLAPTEWRLIYDGESVSLEPSIGNWSFDCQSHYWIEGSRVIWAKRWSRAKIEAGRTRDRQLKQRYFGQPGKSVDEYQADGALEHAQKRRWLRRLFSPRR